MVTVAEKNEVPSTAIGDSTSDLPMDEEFKAAMPAKNSGASVLPKPVPERLMKKGESSGEGGSGSVSDGYEVVFVKDNVSVHPSPAASERINGRLQLIKQGPSLFMTWIPYTQGGLAEEGAFVMLPNGRQKAHSQGKTSDKDRNLYTIRAVSVSEMFSIRRHTPTLGWQYVIIVLNTGLAFPPLYFHNGGVREFLSTLKERALLIRSAEDPNTYLVNDIRDPLQRSLTSLDLQEAVVGLNSVSSGSPLLAVDEASETNPPASMSPRPEHEDIKDPQQAMRDISYQVLEKFSLVTKLARDTTAHLFGPGGGTQILGSPYNPNVMPPLVVNPGHPPVRPVTTRLGESLPTSGLADPIPLPEKGGSFRDNSITADTNSKRQGDGDEEASTNVGSFELVDGLPQEDSPALVWARARPPPLGAEEWATFLDSEGRVTDSKSLRKRIFHGGIEPAMRREVWKFLLGYFAFDSTYTDRQELVESKKKEYEVLKAQWQTVSEAQAQRFAKFRERRSRVDKDVVRTDRSQPFFDGDDNPNVALLRNILITYSFYNFDLGYCQGMSDLLSPILFIMEEEATSFWCFAALMEKMASNFHRDQNGMHSQLLALSKLVQLLDPPLQDYLKSVDCLNYFFCFRWVLIQFKREFSYETVLRLWEVFWTRHLSEHFHLYVCVAVLKRHRRRIMDEQMEFDMLLKFINDLSGRIELESTLRDAEALCVYAGERGVACMPPTMPVNVEGP